MEAIKPLELSGHYVQLSVILGSGQNQRQEAKVALEKAISFPVNIVNTKDTLWTAYTNLGSLLKETGDFAGAAKNLQKAMDLKPSLENSENLIRMLGSCLLSTGKYREAAHAYETFVQTFPYSIYLGMACGFCAQAIRHELLVNDTHSNVERAFRNAKHDEMMQKAFRTDPNLPWFKNLKPVAATNVPANARVLNLG